MLRQTTLQYPVLNLVENMASSLLNDINHCELGGC